MNSKIWREEMVRGWGMAVGGMAKVLRPTTAEQVADAFGEVRALGGAMALRGSGCSYGDAALASGGRVLDLSAMNQILAFDPIRGIARVEPGVTIRKLWQHTIAFGWWPKVVPGTSAVSCGGAAAMNIHGKNNFAMGTFGESVLAFTLLTPHGELLRCSREQNADVFFAAISGFGMLGCFTELTIELKRVHSGRLKVAAIVARDLAHNLQILEDMRGAADYLVSWLNLHASGRALGCGVMHRADQFEPGEDPEGLRYFDPALQDVPTSMFGVVPKGWLWPGMWAATNLGMVRAINWAKFKAAPLEARGSPYVQSHGAFHFLLDYVPRWHWMTKPGGLVQFQPFVPYATGELVLRTVIEECQKAKLVPYLGVLKRHRPDPFLMTHSVDGYSLAMDFAVSTKKQKRAQLWGLCQRLAEVVLQAGGRFYYAKDAMLLESSFARVHGAAATQQFRALKQRLDPQRMLQTDLSRRLGV
ncbi:MAG: FAD-binding oxidoreductase [Planctomycetota bacterium]|nr:FAD-binding oxidoreductase [Planctomycetota bacterium]MSR39655.1 FAD-binding oxidoreductase [Planctomycetota bacterium]